MKKAPVSVQNVQSFKELPRRLLISRIFFFGMVIIYLITALICVINAVTLVNKAFPGFLINQRMVIGYKGPSYWSGVQHGLKFPDKLLKANNRVISSLKDLEDVISSVRISDPVMYTIQKGEEIIEIAIPTMRFAWSDLIMTFGITFLSSIIYFFFGIIVFILKPDTKTSWVFLAMCLLLSISDMTSFDSESTHVGLVYLYLFVNAYLAATVVHLSLLFPEKSLLIVRYPYIAFAPYLVSTALLVPIELSYPGPLAVSIIPIVLVYIGLSVFALIISTVWVFWKSSSTLGRTRAKVIFFGMVLCLPIPALAPIVSFFGGTLANMPVRLTVIPQIIFPGFIAYSIIKHNLFDADVYIKRTVGYVIMTLVVGTTYFSIQSLMSTVILRPILGENAEKVYPILFALIVVFLFNPINRRVQEGVDKLFFRKRFDYKATVASVTNALTSLLNLDEIIKKVIGTARGEMFIDTAGVIVLDPKKQACQTFFIGDGPNNVKDQEKDIPCSYDDPLIALLSKEKRLITRFDIAEDPKYKDMQDSCGNRFSEMEASIAIPLVYQDKLTGLLALGNKKSGHFYTREDIDLLETLANQGAIAIENARLFTEYLEKGRMEEELKIAHNIQLSMLPDKAPEIEGFKIAARSIPAREVGGDFYDFIEVQGDGSNKRLGIVIGDVSGKGVSAALMMAASRSIYRVLADANPSVEDLMSMGNKLLNRDIKKGMFVSLLYAELNPEGKFLTLSNAGQTKPVICPNGNSKPSFIDTDGDKFPLGIIGDCKYQEKQVALKEGDTITFYTDGVVEAMNGKEEMFGFDRLITSIEEGRGLDAEAMLEKLMNDISNFVGGVEQHDDLTLVMVKVG